MSCLHIKAERLYLSDLELRDAEALTEYRKLEQVARFQGWDSYCESDARQLIASMLEGSPWQLDAWYQLGIHLTADMRMIGDVGFRRRTNGPSYDLEIGYSLHPLHQKQGYMREALLALIDWAGKHLLVRRFTASLDPRNEDSARLLVALGFTQEARFKESVWFKGEWADDAVYVLRRPG